MAGMSAVVFGIFFLALSTSVAGQAGSGGECTISGSTEYLYLVQQWGTGYCATASCAVSPPTDRFSLHGLWPNYCKVTNGAAYPQNCPGAAYDESTFSDLIPQMQQNWPSFSSNGNSYFWSHEWDKHGTCSVSYLPSDSLTTQHDYFALALQLRSASNLYSNLAAQGINPSATAYSSTAFKNAIQASLGVNPYLNCGSGGVLTELWLCYNQNQQLVSCGDSGNCGSSVIYKQPAGSSPSSPPPTTASPKPPPPASPTPSSPPPAVASPPPALKSPPPTTTSPPPSPVTSSPPPPTTPTPTPPAATPPTCTQSGSVFTCPAGLACRFKTTSSDTTGHCCRPDQKYETTGKCQCDYAASDPSACTCPANQTLGNTGQNTPATKATDGHCA